MSTILNQMPNIGLQAAVAIAHAEAIKIDRELDARGILPGRVCDYSYTSTEAGEPFAIEDEQETDFPITHHFGRDAKAAERHYFTLTTGGWAAKLKQVPAEGWQVVITGFRGVQHAHSVR